MPEEKNNSDEINEALKEAISVPGNHACKSDHKNMCSVSRIISERLMVVNNKNYISCPCYIPFGSAGFCSSKVRKSIYDRFNI